VNCLGNSGKDWLAKFRLTLAAGTEAVDRADSGHDKLHRLEENIGAVDVELSSSDLHQLESAASKIPVQGARYPEQLQKLVGR
jgi:hypothetical protein